MEVPETQSQAARKVGRWSRLSLRTLLVAVVVVGLPISWAANRINSQRRAIEAIQRAGGYVLFDYQKIPSGQWNPKLPRPDRGRLAQLFPPELFEEVTLVNLRDRPIGDRELRLIGRLGKVEYLDLQGTKVTDAGLSSLRGCTSLEFLWLANTSIGDLGARHLASIPSLVNLTLDDTQVGDDGLTALSELDGLVSLGVRNTRVGKFAAAEYRRKRPGASLND